MEYKQTLNMNKSGFPMRGGLPMREPDMLKHWQELDLYNELLKKNEGKPRFALHDGPPFSNGALHMGHALNKCIKDFMIRSSARLLQGDLRRLLPLPYTDRQLSLRVKTPYLSFSLHTSATVYPFIVPLSRKTPAEIQKMFKTERLCCDCKPRAHVVCLGDTNNMGGNDTHGR